MSDRLDTLRRDPPSLPQSKILRAPVWRRAVAFALDGALLAPLLLLVAWLWGYTFDISLPRRDLPLLDWLVQLGRGDDPMVIGGLLVGILTWGFYQLTFHLLFSTTPGLTLLGLRLVDERATPLGPAQAIVRVASSILSGLFFLLGYVWIVFDSGRQGFHDKVAGTQVIGSKIL